MLLSLDLLAFQNKLQIHTENGKQYVYCFIRKKRLVLTPEEIVRQLLIHYFIAEKNYNPNRINVEKQLNINGLLRRFDIIVYGIDMHPFVLVECKAPKIPVNQGTFDQVAQYNFDLKVDYLVVTNGISTFCTQMDYTSKSYEFVPQIPSYPH